MISSWTLLTLFGASTMLNLCTTGAICSYRFNFASAGKNSSKPSQVNL